MLWRQEGIQLTRTPLRSAAFCLALTLVMGLLSITMGLCQAAKYAEHDIGEQYTTIAALPRISMMSYATVEEGKAAKERVNQFYLDAVTHETVTLEQAEAIERHSTLLAYDHSLTSVTTGYVTDGSASGSILDYPNNLALFAVTCTEQTYLTTRTMPSSTGSRTVAEYRYSFDVKDTAVLHSDFTAPKVLTVKSTLNGEDRSPIFEVGMTYWVCGYYENSFNGAGELQLPFINSLNTDRWSDDGVICLSMPLHDTQYQIAVIGTYEGPITEHPHGEVRRMWEKTLETLQITTHTLLVRSADQVSHMLPFAAGYHRLILGEDFSKEDVAQGRKAAIVSEIFAERNGLTVGDTVELSLYQAIFGSSATYANPDGAYYPIDVYGYDRNHHEALIRDASRHISTADGSYTIVGIYSAERGIVNDYHMLHPNTVLVPQALLPGHYSTSANEWNVTFVLPNDGIDAFEEELASYGYGEMMEYDDGGYSVIMPNVKTIRDSAGFVNGIVTALWLIVVLAVLFFFILMQIPAGRVKYRLGTGRRAIWGEMSFSAILLLVISGAVGCLGSILLYDRALGWMMSTEFTSFNTAFSTQSAHAEMLEQLLTLLGQTPSFFVLAAACQVGVLAVLSVTLSAAVAFRKSGWNR